MTERRPPMRYEAVAVSDESTVVVEFVPEAIARDAGYQREADLEAAFIKRLESQAYTYLRITSEAELVANLRV